MNELAKSFSIVDQTSCILQRILNERNISEEDLRKMMNLLLNNKDLKNIDSFLSAFLTGISFLDLSSDDISSLVDEILEFINDFYSHIQNFHYKNGISLGYAIYNNFPFFNKNQQKLKDIVEISPININYIGEISEKKINEKINEIEQLKVQLKNLKNQTRFTAFSSGDDIYIFQVSNL